MISKRRVWLRVAACWLHTFVALFTMTGVMAIIVFISVRFGGAKIVLPVLFSSAGFALLMYFLSEVIICRVCMAEKPDPAKYPLFPKLIDKIWGKRFFRPRLYILHFGEKPNACAFGLGLFGQYGVGISPELYYLLDEDQLEGVLRHEVAHIHCKDVGLFTLLVLITGGAEKISQLFIGGKTTLGRGPFALIIGVIFALFARLIIPMGRSAISQEREYCADALAALGMNSPEPLAQALQRLSENSQTNVDGPGWLDDLFISHPRMDKRLAALRTLADE